jgi:hypothetical protein
MHTTFLLYTSPVQVHRTHLYFSSLEETGKDINKDISRALATTDEVCFL